MSCQMKEPYPLVPGGGGCLSDAVVMFNTSPTRHPLCHGPVSYGASHRHARRMVVTGWRICFAFKSTRSAWWYYSSGTRTLRPGVCIGLRSSFVW